MVGLDRTGDEEAAMELVSIGDFARVSGLSPRALRLYDELGLLIPARVDPDTGYRWYDAGQTGRARLIMALRHLGVPLPRVAAVLDCAPAEASEQIAAYWADAEFDHHGRRALAGYLVGELAGRPPERYDVQLRELPARPVLSLRRHVTPDELVLIGRDFIVRRMREAGVPRVAGAAGAPFLIYHGMVTADSDGPVEWCRPIPAEQAGEIAASFPDLVLRTDPEHQQAYVHLPSAQSDPEAWLVMQSLAAWAVEHGRQPAGGLRFVLGPGRTPDGQGPAADLAIPLRAAA
jgi:DNA-binding transcriptional MerR regulator